MYGRVVKEVANGARKVCITVAEELQDRGFKRAIDAIDPALVAQTAEKVANAFSDSKMMTASQKSRTGEIVITSMPHSSPEDPEEHSTIFVKDSMGRDVCVGHVATNANKQQPAR